MIYYTIRTIQCYRINDKKIDISTPQDIIPLRMMNFANTSTYMYMQVYIGIIGSECPSASITITVETHSNLTKFGMKVFG